MSGSILDLISTITPNIQINGASNLVDDAQLPNSPKTPEKTNAVGLNAILDRKKRKECEGTARGFEPGYVTPPSSKRLRSATGYVACQASPTSTSLTPHIRKLTLRPGSGAPGSSGLTPAIHQMAISNASQDSSQNNTSAPATTISSGANGAAGQPDSGMVSNMAAPAGPAPSAPFTPAPSAAPSQAPGAPRRRAQGTPVMVHPIPFVLPESAQGSTTAVTTSFEDGGNWFGMSPPPRVVRQTTTADFTVLMDTDGESSSPERTSSPSDGSASD